jgi:Mrp family chromosome partitioning ATPase
MLAHPDSARAAAYRMLCENLLEKGLPRVVAVSSAAPGEGKTSCALNLALAFAEQRGPRVLLVDGNFFAPELAKVFGVDETVPQSTSLELPWLAPYTLVELTQYLHVAVMAGDRPPARFDARRFDLLIDLLSGAGYVRLVIDTPAIDGSAAVRRVIAAADGVLLAVRAGRTTTRALRRAMDKVPKGMLLGATLVDADNV